MTTGTHRKRSATAAPFKNPKTGRWDFVCDVGVGLDGRRKQARRGGFPTKRAAQEALNKLRREVDTRSFVPPAQQTFREYLDRWLEGLPLRLRPSTVDGYRRCLLYIPAGLGAKRLDQVTAGDLDRLYRGLEASGRRRGDGGLSKRSIRYCHTVIQKALGDAVKKGELARNVATMADPPRAKETKAPEMKWWKPEELARFLAMTADERLGASFRVAAMTGMRRGEVYGLQWSDVDLEGARLEVRRQLLTLNGQLYFSERTKTDHGRRSIDLDAGTVAILRAHKARQAAEKLAIGASYQDGGLVFAEPDGSPIDPESAAKVFDRRVARSGLPRLRFHDLRHTHVAHLIEAGENVLVVSKRLGHGSASFTMDRYGHLFPTAGAQAASAVAAMVDGL